ncbi:MAG: hypothetical protein P8Y13_08835 [Deinococcales bacterium]|jgi:predicted lipoprotein with Yx(FWY)xxD motif
MGRTQRLLAILVLLGGVAATAPWATAQGGGPVTVEVAHSSRYGAYLTDAQGLALYVAAQPGQVSRLNQPGSKPIAACTATCLAVWPPVVTQGAPVAGSGVQADLLGTVKGPNGGTQVSYDGWPLYTFAADSKRGEAYGQAVAPPEGAALGAAWYLIAPDGTIILTKPPS